MRIDLHTHSLVSDGTDTPSELVASAKVAGLDVIGLTDHDTIGGWEEAAAAARREQIKLVRGMETTVSCRGTTVHLLGYLFNPDHPKLQEHFYRMRNGRAERVQEMVRRLSEDFPVNLERIMQSSEDQGTIGRPHIADELVRIGVVKTRSEAFAEIIKPGSKYYARNESPNLFAAISWIVDAGGKAVLAHPKATARGEIIDDADIRQCVEAGLFGIEIWHRENPKTEWDALSSLADELGLEKFGASDYHGSGKPNQIGENTTAEDVYRKLIEGTFLPVI